MTLILDIVIALAVWYIGIPAAIFLIYILLRPRGDNETTG